MTKILTAASVAKLKPSEKRQEVPDKLCPGLYLIIQPKTGAKRWALRYRRPGDERPAKLTLGSVDLDATAGAEEPVVGGHLSLADARRLAGRLRNEVARGIDPGVKTLRSEADLFPDAARDFIKHRETKKRRRIHATAALLGLKPNGDLVPGGLAERWRKKSVADVDEDSLFKVVDEARTKGVPGLTTRRKEPSEAMARLMFSALSSLFGFLKAHRRVRTNPMAGLKRPAPAKSRDRVLDDAEIRLFWKACGNEKTGKQAGLALKLLLLTGARLNEVAGMRRDELDKDIERWTIPGERSKNHRAHTVPLPPQAQELVKQALALAPDSDFVFTTNGQSPLYIGSKIKNRLDELMGDPAPWRLHDLRRTAAMNLQKLGVKLEVTEALLNHVSGSRAGIVGIYQRYQYGPEVAAALKAWAQRLDNILSEKKPTNVVALR